MTALLGPIPPRHLTARAEWWLTHSAVIMPREYRNSRPVGLPACVSFRAREQRKAALDAFVKQLGGPLTATAIGELDREGSPIPPIEVWYERVLAIARLAGEDVKAIQNWAAGVQDVRALYIYSRTGDMVRDGKVYCIYAELVKYGEATSRFVFSMREAMQPTCGMCRMLMDKALENAEPKTGRYPTGVVNQALTGWKELK